MTDTNNVPVAQAPRFEIRNTRDVAAERFTCLVYGNPGVGKTTLARTCPGPVLILSAESGLLSLAGQEIDVIEVTSWAMLNDVAVWLRSEEARHYKTIFIDSLTELSQRLVESLKEKYPDRKDSFPLWGEYSDTMRRFIKFARDLRPYNVIFTALSSTDKDEVGRRYTSVNIQGSKVAADLPAFFDEVFALRIFTKDDGTETRALVTREHDGWTGKDRSGRLELFEPPDISKLSLKVLAQ
jgi:phage nucleotide-binding protein